VIEFVSDQQDLGSDFERPGQPHQGVHPGHPAAVLDVADLGPVQRAPGRHLLLGKAKAAGALRVRSAGGQVADGSLDSVVLRELARGEVSSRTSSSRVIAAGQAVFYECA
jgi:hypothetical protein